MPRGWRHLRIPSQILCSASWQNMPDEHPVPGPAQLQSGGLFEVGLDGVGSDPPLGSSGSPSSQH